MVVSTKNHCISSLDYLCYQFIICILAQILVWLSCRKWHVCLAVSGHGFICIYIGNCSENVLSKLPYVRRLARVARTAQASATWNQSQRAPKTLFISRLLEPSVVCMKDDNFSPNTCLLLSRQSKVQCKPKWRTFALLLQQTDFKGLRFLFAPHFSVSLPFGE